MIKILVVGETCLDKFVYCTSERLSPEAPVPVIIPIDTVVNSGMSGNVVRNLLSINTDLEVEHWFQKNKVEKTRYVDKKSNHIFIRIDEGDKNIEQFSLTEELINKLKKFDIVIVSDYNKGFLNLEIIDIIAENSNLSILDTKRTITEKISNTFSFIKLNEKEYSQNLHLKNLSNVLITLGANGTKFKNKIYPVSETKETIDVSGAGDTFTASFILKYYETKDVDESIYFANKMSSIVVSKKGVSIPN